jgi:hypothetical protein
VHVEPPEVDQLAGAVDLRLVGGLALAQHRGRVERRRATGGESSAARRKTAAPVSGEGQPSLLLVSDEGEPVFGDAPATALEPAGACAGSVVTAPGGGDEWYAVWWALRDGASVALMSSRSDDGGASWGEPVLVDGRDRGARGCLRPAPGIAVDPAGGYTHVAYWFEPPGEQGIWYAHSMERGAMWHAPTAIIFGADPASASVAANGDTVVVAYEHPLATEGRIGVAVSRTAGHLIEGRAVASAGAAYAVRPLVAVRGSELIVAWIAREGRGAGAAEYLVMRRGRLSPPSR